MWSTLCAMKTDTATNGVALVRAWVLISCCFICRNFCWWNSNLSVFTWNWEWQKRRLYEPSAIENFLDYLIQPWHNILNNRRLIAPYGNMTWVSAKRSASALAHPGVDTLSLYENLANVFLKRTCTSVCIVFSHYCIIFFWQLMTIQLRLLEIASYY